jgi:hypothetical protein
MFDERVIFLEPAPRLSMCRARRVSRISITLSAALRHHNAVKSDDLGGPHVCVRAAIMVRSRDRAGEAEVAGVHEPVPFHPFGIRSTPLLR